MNLVLILGDQLDEASSAFDGFDSRVDKVLMIEAREEATHVWSHKARTAIFLSAMRHFAVHLQSQGKTVIYRCLATTLADALKQEISQRPPQKVIMVEPGDLRVEEALLAVCPNLEIRSDRHFMCSKSEFAHWAGKSKTLRMEFFYRLMRQKYGVLMTGEIPIGGVWNLDADNRKAFGKAGPKNLPKVPVYPPDAITNEVIEWVASEYAEHPGSLAEFNWPVTRAEAIRALNDFISHRLPNFGPHQDAMWQDMPFAWHSLLSTSLNLKLLNPREVIAAAEAAYHVGHCDLASVEGFIRQILGWREFMRGVYFLDMPTLKTDNHFAHQQSLPQWYWTGETQMNCMRQSIGQTLRYGYAHHIQRLMVTGIFGVLAEIKPQALCDWYLSVYVDAIEWVELPNTAGMALYANGGRFTSKPYVASGAYIKRMSNYCTTCHYLPELKTGPRACPVSTLYANFVDKHIVRFAANPRTALMANNIKKLSDEERAAIRTQAAQTLANLDAL